MHELAIAENILEHVLRIAGEQRATRVLEVEVVCGVVQQIVPEALTLGFAAQSAGTAAEGAALKVTEEPVRARCRDCRAEFAAAIDDYRCPTCRRADVELVAGRDIVLKTVVCETGNEPQAAAGRA